MRMFILAATAAALIGGPALAQNAMSTTTTTTKTAGHPKVTTTHVGSPPRAARTEASLACSASADSKNIHGKDRKKFMSACKKGK